MLMENLSTVPDKTKPPRQRILETAHRLFYQNGIRATGIDRIIAESSVTKTTFYRQFKSKNNLIIAYLEYRHQLFLEDFSANLQVNGGDICAISKTIEQWFRSEGFRGCAFLNSVGELGQTLPEVNGITQQHKLDLAKMIEGVLAEVPGSEQKARAIVTAIDGATVRAQYERESEPAVALLKVIIHALLEDGACLESPA